MALSEPPSKLDALRRVQADSVVLVWGYQEPPGLADYAREHGIPLYRVEDGFVRSVGLGAAHTPARSLVLDKSGHLYFDADGPSELEVLCQTYDFDAHPALMQEAEDCRRLLLESGISKYNTVAGRAALRFPSSARKRVLVVGQVEDDASILRGRAADWTNLRAVREASKENPGADIVFKPHPDALHGYTGKRKMPSSPEEIRVYARVLEEDVSVADALDGFAHVYTITSLAGFEAVLRGIPTTVFGYPFYAGWGLTDDRQVEARRSRRLSASQVFAAAYLLYPRYFDPDTGRRSSLKEVIEAIRVERGRLA
jgi:capsular polysaccharide export protein